MEECKLQDTTLIQGGNDLREENTAWMEAEDFVQIEDKIWEEYLLEESHDSEITPERSLVRTRMADRGTAQVVFAIVNLFFMIFLFCGWHISLSFLVGSCSFVGFLMATILMCQACIAGYDENRVFMQGLLLYFPVERGRLRGELYLLLWKYIGIQSGIICVPMLMNMCIAFRPDYFLIALVTMVLSMLMVGVLIVEVSMSRLKVRN